MTEENKILTKKDLIELLKPYDDDKLICFSVKLQQGTVGFLDITHKEHSKSDYIILTSEKLNEWYLEDIKELKNEKRSREHCLMYTGDAKCHYTGEICDDDFVQICEDYRSDEGTYPCPHCNRTGLKPLNYGSENNPEIVWECMRCGAELWYCETIEEMQRRCKEIKERSCREMTEKRFTFADGFKIVAIRDNGEIMNSKEVCEKLNELAEENEQLKKENYELHKRLGDFEPFERYMKERTSKTSLEDIIGIVKTDEPTNSVELKKELYK